MKARTMAAAVLVTGGLAFSAAPMANALQNPAPSATSEATSSLVAQGIADQSGAITDAGLRTAFDMGIPIVEAVSYYSHYDTTTGVIYRVVHDTAQLTAPTVKFVVATGQPPADEFLATTNLANLGSMQKLVGHYDQRVYYAGRFFNTSYIQLPGAIAGVGIAFITP